MKTTKITYYITTGLLSVLMLFSAYAYLTNPDMKGAFQHLGFPDYFRIELAIAKLLAAFALWVPFRLAKDVAYIGLSISFISATIAHSAAGDPISACIVPLVIFAILVLSYLTGRKLATAK